MRRVFVLINNTGLGGAERRFGSLFARMAHADHGATFVVNAGLWRRLVEAGVVTGNEERVWRLAEPARRLAELIGLRGGAAFWLRKGDYVLFGCLLFVRYLFAARRLFHLVLGGTYVGLPLMLLRPGHRVVISVTNPNLSALVGTPRALPFFQFALARCTVIDALTGAVRDALVRRGLPGEKIQVSTGSVVDTERFRPSADKELWVVFAGRLVAEKNPLLFVEAIPAVLRSVPTARFFLFGEGPLRLPVEEAISRLGLRHAVEIGFCPDIGPILGKARVFVSLQRSDNYPSQALLEAMACGAAVVATDVGLTRKLVEQTVGLLVEARPAAVAEAVAHLLSRPDLAGAMGLRGRERVSRFHSAGVFHEYLRGIYVSLCGERVTAS